MIVTLHCVTNDKSTVALSGNIEYFYFKLKSFKNSTKNSSVKTFMNNSKTDFSTANSVYTVLFNKT